MPHIIVCTPPGTSSAALIRDLRSCVAGGVSEIAAAMFKGAPLFDGDLVARPPEETYNRVRQILAVLQRAGIEPVIFEGRRPVSPAFVENLIASRNESTAQFDALSEFGHET